MVFPDGWGDVLRLYRADILPVHGPKDAETRDVLELRSVDARTSHLRRVPLFVECTDEELRRIAAIARIVETPTGTLLTEMG